MPHIIMVDYIIPFESHVAADSTHSQEKLMVKCHQTLSSPMGLGSVKEGQDILTHIIWWTMCGLDLVNTWFTSIVLLYITQAPGIHWLPEAWPKPCKQHNTWSSTFNVATCTPLHVHVVGLSQGSTHHSLLTNNNIILNSITSYSLCAYKASQASPIQF